MAPILTTYYHHFIAIIQDNLREPAPPVKNWRILLEQSFNCPHLSIFQHIAGMDDDADAKMILTASPPGN